MYLLFDIGGTHMRLAISRDAKIIIDEKIFDTPYTFAEGLKILKEYAEHYGADWTAVAGGLPGYFNSERTTLMRARNLRGWENVDIAAQLQQTFNAPVYLENDAGLAGLAETIQGAGQGFARVLYITLSTGVGGALIVDGRIDPMSQNLRPGMQTVDSGGDLESYIGGKNLQAKFGVTPSTIPDPEVWKDIVQKLSLVLSKIIDERTPEVVVLGGPVALSDHFMLQSLQETLGDNGSNVVLKKALLGDERGLLGALVYAHQHEH